MSLFTLPRSVFDSRKSVRKACRRLEKGRKVRRKLVDVRRVGFDYRKACRFSVSLLLCFTEVKTA